MSTLTFCPNRPVWTGQSTNRSEHDELSVTNAPQVRVRDGSSVGYRRSKRSSSMTFTQAATKSLTNFSAPSLAA